MRRLIIFLGIGFIFLVVGIVFLSGTLNLVQSAVSTEGTVIKYHRSLNSKRRATYYPIVRFTPQQGAPVEFQSQVGAGSPPAIGSRVKVLYDPHNPQHAEIDSFVSLWLFPLIFGGSGALLILVAMAIAARDILRGR
jgi:hypothetical protein